MHLEVLRLNEGQPDQGWQNEHEAMGVLCRQDMDSILHAVGGREAPDALATLF